MKKKYCSGCEKQLHLDKFRKDNSRYRNECNRLGHTTRSREVVQLALDGSYITKFKTMTIAEKATGCLNSNVSAVCRGIQITAGGYLWLYKEDYE